MYSCGMGADGVMAAKGIKPPLSYAEFRRDYRRLVEIVLDVNVARSNFY